MLFAALPIVALAQGDPSQGRMNARVTEMEKAKDSASNGENDRKFAKDALTMGLTESEIGKSLHRMPRAMLSSSLPRRLRPISKRRIPS